MRTLRAGVLGLGAMGRNHARVLRAMEHVELVAVADPLGDRYGEAGDAAVEEDVDGLLRHDLDLCVVAVPTVLHEPAAVALARAGVAALIEKPLAATVVGAAMLVEEFEGHDVLGCVGHIERYNPALRALQEKLAAGALGAVFSIATRRQGPLPTRIADVGVVKDLATHDIDLTAWLARSRYTSVAARTVSKTGREHEDLLAATGMLADGTIVNHLVNWVSPVKERCVVVSGERGSFIADTLAMTLTFCENGTAVNDWDAVSQFRGASEGDIIRYAIPKPEPLVTELTELVRAVRGEPADIVPLRDGYDAVVVATAMLESSACGQTRAIERRLRPRLHVPA